MFTCNYCGASHADKEEFHGGFRVIPNYWMLENRKMTDPPIEILHCQYCGVLVGKAIAPDLCPGCYKSNWVVTSGEI